MGVNVGSVKNIELDRSNLHLVKVLLRIQSTTPITMGTVGTLTSRGITGVVYIALKDLGNDPRPLESFPRVNPILLFQLHHPYLCALIPH